MSQIAVLPRPLASQRPITAYQVFCKIVAPSAVFLVGLSCGVLLAALILGLRQSPTQPGDQLSPSRAVFLDVSTLSPSRLECPSACPLPPERRPRLRLKKVVHRKPVPFLLFPEREDRAEYLGVYCVETLECGHRVHTFPQADALVAQKRDCKDCGSALIEFPSAPKQRKEAA
jgi:hypothetical protein